MDMVVPRGFGACRIDKLISRVDKIPNRPELAVEGNNLVVDVSY